MTTHSANAHMPDTQGQAMQAPPVPSAKTQVFLQRLTQADLNEVLQNLPANFSGDINVIARDIAQGVYKALKQKNKFPEESSRALGQVVAYDQYGWPWKKIEAKYDGDLAELPVGTEVFVAPVDQLFKIADLTEQVKQLTAQLALLQDYKAACLERSKPQTNKAQIRCVSTLSNALEVNIWVRENEDNEAVLAQVLDKLEKDSGNILRLPRAGGGNWIFLTLQTR